MLWGIELAGNKVWNCANKWIVERWHEIWFWKNVYSSWVNSCYGTFLFDLHWCILFNIAIFIILINRYTLITLYFYVCRWNLKKKLKTINTMNKTFFQITQVVEVARAVTSVPTKNDDQYVWISKQGIVFFEIFAC